MNIWIGSDYHLGHKMLVTQGHRPEGYDSRIIYHLMLVAKPGDLVVNLGDIAFGIEGGEAEHRMLVALRDTDVHTVLVAGNHDGSISGAMGRGWDFACHSFMLDMYGKKWIFTHEPLESVSDGTKNVHGHLHTGEHRGPARANGAHVLISMEYLDYRPISLEKIWRLNTAVPKWEKDRFV